MVQKPSFDSYSFKSSSPFKSTTPKSSITVSPTNRNNFSFSVPSVIKSNDSKPACAPPQKSHLSPFPIKSSRHLFQSSTQTFQSIFSQNQKVFNSTSLFQVSELPFQCNAVATLLFTIIPLRSSAICIFLLNLIFSFILLTCSSCFILNFNILIYILLTVLVFIKCYTNSAGLLFRLMESNRSLIIFIIEFIHILQHGAIFNKMTFSKINSLNKALLIVVVLFLKVKIRKVLRCNIVSSEDLLLSLFIVIVNVIVIFMLSYLCHLIRKFSSFSQFYLSLVSFFLYSYETRVCFFILRCIIYASYSNSSLSVILGLCR